MCVSQTEEEHLTWYNKRMRTLAIKEFKYKNMQGSLKIYNTKDSKLNKN